MKRAGRKSSYAARFALLRDSGAFDATWYLQSYPDIQAAGVDPILHYLQCGASEGRFPNPLFDTRWYISRYRLRRPSQNPLIDFLLNSISKKRDPNPFFSTEFYLKRNPDVAKAGANPLIHFLQFGAAEGRDPSYAFSLRGYLDSNPDVERAGYNALSHFLHCGRNEGRLPLPVEGFQAANAHRQRWMDPQWARSERDARHGCRLRLIVFALGCILHARRRSRLPEVKVSGHSMTAWSFVRLAVRRFQAEGVTSTALNRAVLLSRAFRSEDRISYATQVLASPAAGLMLFTANGLKAEGFFADAEAICRDIIRSGRLRDLALVLLGDLYLIQAVWASEYQAYASHFTAINPGEILNLQRGRTWHDRTFDEAIDLLEQATAVNCENADAWSLLALAYRLRCRWSSSIEANERAAGLRPFRGGGVDLDSARALFGLNEKAGCRLFENAIRGSVHRLSYGMARIVEEPSELDPLRLLALKPTTNPASLSVNYCLIGSGKLAAIEKNIDFPAEQLIEVSDVQLLPEYGSVLVGGNTLFAGASHMRRCHDATFSSGLEAVSNGHALYCIARAAPSPVPIACFIGNNANYFHWLMEDLPRLESLLTDQVYSHLPILIDGNTAPWQVELMRRLGVGDSRLCRVDFTRPVAVRHLVLPPRLSKNLIVHPHVVAYLRERLVPHARQLQPKRGKRLYLARKSALVQRGLLNEAEVMERLRQAGFISVDPGSLSIDEQIKLFSDAEVIAAPGGAALTNILFAPAQTKVLVLSADAILSETFTSLASALGQKYVLCTGPSYPHADRQWIWTRFDFSIDKNDFELGLQQVLH